MEILIRNIGNLAGISAARSPLRGKQMAALESLQNAWLLVRDGCIEAWGNDGKDEPQTTSSQIVDAWGGTVLPAWCDSHTHLVFAAEREAEFVQKIKGISYAEIAASGGGILSSANAVAAMDEDRLFELSAARLHGVAGMGTGAIEIKSGYGLSNEGELKMLRVIRRLKETSPLLIKATFLGAHALPPAFRENRDGFFSLLIHDLMPRIAGEGLADFIDVFCEQGFFTPNETLRLLEAGEKFGLRGKVHANQLSVSGGVEAGVKAYAISVDHLESMDEAAVQKLANSNTMGTLLPTAALFLRMPMPPARHLLDAGAALALATDYNPGSSPSGNMNLVVSLACISMRMTPEESINAATINGAFAMDAAGVVGSIAVGKRANLILTDHIPSLATLPYRFGESCIRRVMLNGQWV